MNILLVEDDKDSREMLEMVLALYGVRVESAESRPMPSKGSER